MTQPTYRIRVESGPDAGFEADLPASGAALGRSSQNDLVFHDGTLSRRHCRIWFDGAVPVVSDLATVNGTFVNGTAIEEDRRLSPGDRISIGGTVLVLSGPDGRFEPPPSEAPAQPGPAPEPPAQTVDLGFGRGGGEAAGPAARGRRVADAVVLALAAAVAAVAAAVWFFRPAAPRAPEPPPPPAAPPLQFDYLKVAGGAESLLRFELTLEADGRLSVAIDDLSSDRRERKTSPSPVSAARREDLAAAFRRAGFLAMDPLAEGSPRADAWNALRISALVDGRAQTVEIRNAPEPEAFRELRETLETFGQNEFGLWAFAFSKEELLARAQEAVEQARRLRDEREVDRGNLAAAVARYRAAKDYLSSFNPKPELFDEAAAGLAEAEAELSAVLERLNWDADHAIQTREWSRAVQALREILEYVPDRTDPRHDAAERRLLDVEKRLPR